MIITMLSDMLTGKNVQGYYKLYKKTEWYDSEKMACFQLDKLKRLVSHVYENVPYYTNFMKSAGIFPGDIKKLDDIESFPVITKEIIKASYDEFTPINNDRIKGVKTKQTGGTTGNILFKRNDANTRGSVWATYRRFRDWMGVKERERTLIMMGGHVIGKNKKDSFKKSVNMKITNSVSFNPYDTSEENFSNIIKHIINHKIVLIRSYSQFLYYIAKRMKEMGLSTKVRAITTTAEPLIPEQRDLFRCVFGAETFDQYGCGEIGGVAYECNRHRGLHIAQERALVEINKKNELVITDLDNYTMPFIRYWNADEAIWGDAECDCGRKGPLVKQILGRTCDYILGANGEYLHWAYFWHLFFDSNIAKKRKLAKFQVVQNQRGSLIIKLVASPLSTEEEALLATNIREHIGNIEIRFVYMDEIEPTRTGKYRPVVNNTL